MKRLLRTALWCGLIALTPTTHADDAPRPEEKIRYVRDVITLPLRQTQSVESAVVHPGVSSGTALTVVKEDADSGFTRVRTADGIEGWIATRHLISEPTARMQLDKVNAELEELRKTNTRLAQEQTNIPADQKLAARQITQLQNENTQLKDELQTLRQAPDNAMQLAQDNIELKKSANELTSQLAAANKALGDFQHTQDLTLFREGALAVFAGAILTALIPRLKPKKRSEWV